jgi:hypothetical protein
MHSIRTEVQEVKELWARLLPREPLPADDQWDLWGALHDPEIIHSALTQTALKYRKLNGAMELDYILRFASAVMSRLSREKQPTKEITMSRKT